MRAQAALKAACAAPLYNLRIHKATKFEKVNVSSSVRVQRTPHLVVRAAQAGVPGGDGAIPGKTPPLLEGPAKFVSLVVKSYNLALAKHPVMTKAATSLIGFALGDRIAQSFGGQPFDVYRCLRLSLYGLLIDGPIGHYFYQFLDTRIRPDDPKGTQSVLTKTAIDQLIWAPAMTVVFLAFLTTLEGRPEAIMSVVQSKLVPIYIANLGIWPLWHLINFRYIPPEQRILFNNLVAILWTTYLSWTCGSVGGHSGTPRDALAGGLPCSVSAAAAILSQSHQHLPSAAAATTATATMSMETIHQTMAVESMLHGWGPDGLPDADAGAELLMNYAAVKAEVINMVCKMPSAVTMP